MAEYRYSYKQSPDGSSFNLALTVFFFLFIVVGTVAVFLSDFPVEVDSSLQLLGIVAVGIPILLVLITAIAQVVLYYSALRGSNYRTVEFRVHGKRLLKARSARAVSWSYRLEYYVYEDESKRYRVSKEAYFAADIGDKISLRLPYLSDKSVNAEITKSKEFIMPSDADIKAEIDNAQTRYGLVLFD